VTVTGGDTQQKLEAANLDLREKLLILEAVEKNSVRSALKEERGRYCIFISCIQPLIVRY